MYLYFDPFKVLTKSLSLAKKTHRSFSVQFPIIIRHLSSEMNNQIKPKPRKNACVLLPGSLDKPYLLRVCQNKVWVMCCHEKGWKHNKWWQSRCSHGGFEQPHLNRREAVGKRERERGVGLPLWPIPSNTWTLCSVERLLCKHMTG